MRLATHHLVDRCVAEHRLERAEFFVVQKFSQLEGLNLADELQRHENVKLDYARQIDLKVRRPPAAGGDKIALACSGILLIASAGSSPIKSSS